MNKNFLLPSNFKKIGIIITPLGFLVWCCTQLDWFGASNIQPHILKVTILIVSFFSFLIGIFFTTFAKEKIEDEFIKSLRLHSFQISALVQLIFFLASFTIMLITNKDLGGDGTLALFLLLGIMLFWFTYIIHFNPTLFQSKNKLNEE